MTERFFIIFLFLGALVFARDVYYFTEDDGNSRDILYIADCFQISGENYCNLKAVSIANSEAHLKCTLTVEPLLTFNPATKSGEVWTVSSTAGLCKYTNTYQFSKTGMIQVKTSPDESENIDFCDVFEPKIYKMKYHKELTSIKMSVDGCKELIVPYAM